MYILVFNLGVAGVLNSLNMVLTWIFENYGESIDVLMVLKSDFTV
jgi:hypothetical protein